MVLRQPSAEASLSIKGHGGRSLLQRGTTELLRTMAELLLWQTHMMQTYRENLHRRINAFRANRSFTIEKLPYPEYQIHYDHH